MLHERTRVKQVWNDMNYDSLTQSKGTLHLQNIYIVVFHVKLKMTEENKLFRVDVILPLTPGVPLSPGRPQRLFKRSPEMRKKLLRVHLNTDLIIKVVVLVEQLLFDFLFVRRGEQQQHQQQSDWLIKCRPSRHAGIYP